jgi:hypothetical protein
LAFDEPYELGVTVNSGTELTPRTLLTAEPYALNSCGVSIAAGAEAGDVLTSDANGKGAWAPPPVGEAPKWQAAGLALFPVSVSQNVGIGTTAPVAKLHVNDGNAIVEQAGNAIASITAKAATVEAQLIADDTTGVSHLNFTYSLNMNRIGVGTPRLRIDTNGLVGLNNGSPDERLDVGGNIRLSNSTPSLLINDSAESANGRLW